MISVRKILFPFFPPLYKFKNSHTNRLCIVTPDSEQ
jgi:hypothetical protein